MLATERLYLTSRVVRASNILNFLGMVLRRFSGQRLTFLIVEGTAARGVVHGEQDCLLAYAFLDDYRRARNRVLQSMAGAALCAIAAAFAVYLAPRFFDEATQGFTSSFWPQ